MFFGELLCFAKIILGMSYRPTNNLIKGLDGFLEIQKSLMIGGGVRFIWPPVKGDGAVAK